MAIIGGIILVIILAFVVYVLAAPVYKYIGRFIERKTKPFKDGFKKGRE